MGSAGKSIGPPRLLLRVVPLFVAPPRPSDPLVEVVRRYRNLGFPSKFQALPGGNVMCHSCGRSEPARWVPMLALLRLEPDGQAGQNVAVAAVECPACEERGTLTLQSGKGAPAEENLVLSMLPDRRDQHIVSFAMNFPLNT